MQLLDTFGRKINYLRLSVTDRCNMRCCYCMPKEGVAKLDHTAILSYEQLFLLARSAVSLGVRKIRVTGGEPLVRKGIVDFLGRLAQLPGLEQLALTTNGLRLSSMVEDLAAAGVKRLNISLDSLRPEVFARVTRRGGLQQVLEGISSAEDCGLSVKINMVVMRGVNDSEILNFARLTRQRKCSVRFIEYMPVIQEQDWQRLVVPGHEILARIATEFDYTPILRGELAGPAQEFKIAGSSGTIGVITALSGHFCSDCNRIRIAATGKAKSCLFADEDIALVPALRSGNPEVVKAVLLRLVGQKPAMHGLSPDQAEHQAFSMAQIGG